MRLISWGGETLRGGFLGTPTVRNIGLAEVAKAFDVSPATLERQLALLGWGIVMNEAERLAFSEAFGKGTARPKERTSAGDVGKDLPLTEWKHMEAAFRALVPQFGALPSEKSRPPRDKRAGAIYVLHDGVTGLSKIGCTSGTGRRQRSQMASHGTVLVNLLNATIADMRAAEA
jgi:hypothetical protein